jgi:hypothetical protein
MSFAKVLQKKALIVLHRRPQFHPRRATVIF